MNGNWLSEIDEGRVELVFSGRFKGYGAYQIRKNYYRNKAIAMLLSVGLLLGAGFLLVAFKKAPEKIQGVGINAITPRDTMIKIEFYFPQNETHRSQESSAGGKSGGMEEFQINPFLPEIPSYNHGRFFGRGDNEEGNNETNTGKGVGNGSDTFSEKKENSGRRINLTRNAIYINGGEPGLIEGIKSVMNYPSDCISASKEQTFKITLYIDKKGFVTGCSYKPNVECDGFKNAIETAAKSVGKFLPAQDSKGKAINSQFTFNLIFQLDKE